MAVKVVSTCDDDIHDKTDEAIAIGLVAVQNFALKQYMFIFSFALFMMIIF